MEQEHVAHTRLHGESPDLDHGAELTLVRRVQHNRDGADDAQEAAQDAKHVEPLVQYEVRQDGTAQECAGIEVVG